MSRRMASLTVALVATVASNLYWPSVAATDSPTPMQSEVAVGQPPVPDPLRPMSKQAFDEACKAQGYERGVTLIGTQQDAYSIRCVDDDGTLQKIDRYEQIHEFVSEACNWTYSGRRNTDRLATMGKTYDAWECASYGSYAGVPDLKGWCESKGLQLINRKEIKYPAYRWFCADSAMSKVEGIPLDKVCEWQFGEDALDRTFNTYGKQVADAWDCFYVT